MVWWEVKLLSFPFLQLVTKQSNYPNGNISISILIIPIKYITIQLYQITSINLFYFPNSSFHFLFLSSSWTILTLTFCSFHATTTLLMIVYSESNKLHSSMTNYHPFSVALFSVMYWYIISVQHIPLPLDGEYQILLFNWLEYKTIHTTWFIHIPLSFIWMPSG